MLRGVLWAALWSGVAGAQDQEELRPEQVRSERKELIEARKSLRSMQQLLDAMGVNGDDRSLLTDRQSTLDELRQEVTDSLESAFLVEQRVRGQRFDRKKAEQARAKVDTYLRDLQLPFPELTQQSLKTLVELGGTETEDPRLSAVSQAATREMERRERVVEEIRARIETAEPVSVEELNRARRLGMEWHQPVVVAPGPFRTPFPWQWTWVAGQRISVAVKALVPTAPPEEDKLPRDWWQTQMALRVEDWVAEKVGALAELRSQLVARIESFNALDSGRRTEQSDCWRRIQQGQFVLKAVAADLDAALEIADNHGLDAAFAGLERLRGALGPLPPAETRVFPAGWPEAQRVAWPEHHGTFAQMELVESYDPETNVWRLVSRDSPMLLVVSTGDGTPYLVDRHEVTIEEFDEAMTEMGSRRTLALDSWWRENRNALITATQPGVCCMLFGVSCDVASDFARHAYPMLSMRLPTKEFWRDIANAAAPGDPALDKASSFLEPPVIAGPAVGLIGIHGGLSEWCMDPTDPSHGWVCGLSAYKPWTSTRAGYAGWANEKQDYLKLGATHCTERPQHVQAPAYGFRCVFRLREILK